MTTQDLNKTEYDPYYQRYISKVGPVALRDGLEINQAKVISFFEAIDAKHWDFRYALDKWSIKEVLQHIIDTERIFIYRCFRIARQDKTPLANFDQDIYIAPSNARNKSKDELLEEYKATRQYSISILKSLSDDDLSHIGIASNKDMSARALAFSILGHENWHKDILAERYLANL